MSDFLDHLTKRKNVAVFPNEETSEQLQKIRSFWDEDTSNETQGDLALSSLSNLELEHRLWELGITETDMPKELHGLISIERSVRARIYKMALAASLLGAVGLGVIGFGFWEDNKLSDSPTAVATSVPEKETDLPPLDPYLIPPDRKGTPPPSQSATNSDPIRNANSFAVGEEVTLSRGEIRELQKLLNRFGFGSISEFGLPSKGTDEAVAAFRQKHELASGGADRIVLELLRELAREAAIKNLEKSILPVDK